MRAEPGLMLSRLTDRIERAALRAAPSRAARLMGVLPPAALPALQASRFRRTLRLAAERSPFYRDAFRRRGIDVARIRHPSELGDFYTTGEDLRTHGPAGFLAGRADTAFETTGTTSPVPKRVYFSNRELDGMGTASAAALHLLGVRRDDRVLSAFDCSFWVSPAVTRSALQYLDCFHVEAGKIDPLECYLHAVHYSPTIIFGEPSWLVRFSQVAAARGTWPVKLLVCGGENMTEAAREQIQAAWSAPVVLNYGQTEAFGSLGLECRERAGYHRNDLHFLFEIDAPDPEGWGELIYTTLTRDVMPLIRYRAGDVTRLEDRPCACGLFAKRLAKIRARADEMVVCGMGNVGPWVFDELLRGILAVGAEWQAVVTSDGQLDVMTLHAETEDAAGLDRQVRDHLRERFPDFWKNLKMELYSLHVIPAGPGTLRQMRKLQRVVDRRQAALTPAAKEQF
jgi:phenylacetate-CoA ligase